MTTALITPPASEPLSLEEIKAHLRVDHDHEDALLIDTLRAARQYAEFASGQRFITQAWRQYESAVPRNGRIALRLAPVQSVASLTLFDRDGAPSVLAADEFAVRPGPNGTLDLGPGVDRAAGANGVEIDFVLGFGDHATDVPETLRRAVLLLVAHWYEFRGAIQPSQQPVSLPPGFEELMRAHRAVRV